jgi:hypothetical protein
VVSVAAPVSAPARRGRLEFGLLDAAAAELMMLAKL